MLGFFKSRRSDKDDMRERYLHEAEMAREYEYAMRQQAVLNEHQINQERQKQMSQQEYQQRMQ